MRSMRANPLRAWLKRNRVPVAKFAARVNRSRSSLTRNLLPLDHPDFQVPRSDAMALIYLETGGEIQPNGFYILPALQPAQAPANDSIAPGQVTP